MRGRLALLAVCVVLACLNSGSSAITDDSSLKNTKVERTIELVSNVAHLTHVITAENTSGGSVKSYTFAVEPSHSKNIAFVGAKLSGTGDEKKSLKVTELSQDSTKGSLYKIDFTSELAAGKSITFEVEVVLHDSMRPYPTEISQSEKQLVVFDSNVYFYSIYPTQSQKTVVNLASDRVESYTQLKPTSKSDSTVTYGPYENIKALQQEELRIHFENNAPFLTVENLQRTIEISHWGNIAVEETMDVVHTGAKLVGAFSRFDYMRRQGGSASVKAFKMLLPAGAQGVYYRDEIGNISTSNLRTPSAKSKKAAAAEPIELELRPRFPLFGGWRTHYTVGYNVPAYHHLFNKGNEFVLKMKLIDHLIDDQYVENADIRIILPEHSTNIEFVAPYTVERKKNELHFTYLDTVGRPVVVVNKKHSVENHIQDFQIKYTYNKNMIFSKPLLLVGVFFLAFLLVIIAVRINFSLSPRKEKEN